QPQKNRVGARVCAHAPRTEQVLCRSARNFFGGWHPDFRSFSASSLKGAQDISWLRNFPPRQRVEKWQHAFSKRLFRGGRRIGFDSLGESLGAVALAESIILQWEGTVIVERSAPEHGAGLHHASVDIMRVPWMTFRCPTAFVRNAQITGIDEANEFRAFTV